MTEIKNGRNDNGYDTFQEVSSVVSKLIRRRKEQYQHHMTKPKTYRSTLKAFEKGLKVPIIHSLLTFQLFL